MYQVNIARSDERLISSWSASDSIYIVFKTPNINVLDHLNDEAGILSSQVKLESTFLVYSLESFRIMTNDKESLCLFLKLINRTYLKYGEPIDQEKMNEIYKTLGLNQAQAVCKAGCKRPYLLSRGLFEKSASPAKKREFTTNIYGPN